MFIKEDKAISEYHRQIKKLLYVKDNDIISSFSILITTQDKEFWKILDMFERLPPTSRIKLILLALDMVEIKSHVEKKHDKITASRTHVPIIPETTPQCDKNECDMTACEDKECSTLVHVEIKNRLALMHLRDWSFKFGVVSFTAVVVSLIIMMASGVELLDGILSTIVDDVFGIIKLIATS